MPVVNTLTSSAGFKLGPVLFETLLKHYFDRVGGSSGEDVVQLRKDEILYDEAFNVVKTFLDVSTRHTVEELQGFSNARTPSPPWVHLVRLVVPMSTCEGAAVYLIKALGGVEVCNRVVGGTKWWQVRGIRGVDAEWITAKKDWQEAKRRYKSRKGKEASISPNGSDTNHAGPSSVPMSPPRSPGPVPDAEADGKYRPDMDAMRCILYSHGGGYYFGSVDQERYAIQRLARKINGRVFAVNYRLAPQYPFPCAIQDVLAGYLYLIKPPEGASHAPVKPEHIIFAGDSAGGGLTLAALQVCRDSGLPLPAGAVLISPWCDLTHSFPSIHLNITTDIIPQYGLSMHKPSTLWPPPPDQLTQDVHSGLRSRIRSLAGLDRRPSSNSLKNGSARTQDTSSSKIPTTTTATSPARNDGLPANHVSPDLGQKGSTLDVGTTAPLPTATASASSGPKEKANVVEVTAKDGTQLRIDSQIQLYVSNDLVVHPLVSPALSYLGGLPPMLFIEGEREVLRDEGIYTAHRAAEPSKYPIREEQREMYPPLKGIEERYGPSKVHLQVYDDCPHVLPILFSFTTPAKFQYRAMASFIRHVTGLPKTSVTASNSVPITEPAPSSPKRDIFSWGASGAEPNSPSRRTSFRGLMRRATSVSAVPAHEHPAKSDANAADKAKPMLVDGVAKPAAKRSASLSVTNVGRSLLLRRGSTQVHAPNRPELPTLISEGSEAEHITKPTIPAVLDAEYPPKSGEPSISPPITDVPVRHESPPPISSIISDSPKMIRQTLAVPTDDRSRGSRTSTSSIGTTPPLTPVSPTSSLSRLVKKPSDASDEAGPRFEGGAPSTFPPEVRQAGDFIIYDTMNNPWTEMIRERVSTQGIIRPMESPYDTLALSLDPALVGVVSELAARRYLDGKTKFDHRFRREIKAIQRTREKNLEAAKRDASRSTKKHMIPHAHLQAALFQDSEKLSTGERCDTSAEGGKSLKDGILSAGASSWTWAWALEEESPPPSSIAARRDTQEARALARIADAVAEAETAMSGNNLWGTLMTFLTLGPDPSKSASSGERLRTLDEQGHVEEPAEVPQSSSQRLKSKFLPSRSKSK